MTIEEKIEVLCALGDILYDLDELSDIRVQAKVQNPWFDEANVDKSLSSIRDHFLNKEVLEDVVDKYRLSNLTSSRKVGLILAGNIPLVGFHDVLCNFLCNHVSLIKMSEKDKVLLPFLLNKMIEINPACQSYFVMVDRLQDYEAVIATGSNNTSRYFYQYFNHVPHLIRKNRSSISIFNGSESKDDLLQFQNDVFDYYGLGCRNISKLYIPSGYAFEDLLRTLDSRMDVINHHKYANNYEYNLALYLMNKSNIFQTKSILLKEDQSIASRIACLNFEYYDSVEDLQNLLLNQIDQLQCVSTHLDINLPISTVGLGESQKPKFTDYADGVDTIQFLLGI